MVSKSELKSIITTTMLKVLPTGYVIHIVIIASLISGMIHCSVVYVECIQYEYEYIIMTYGLHDPLTG